MVSSLVSYQNCDALNLLSFIPPFDGGHQITVRAIEAQGCRQVRLSVEENVHGSHFIRLRTDIENV